MSKYLLMIVVALTGAGAFAANGYDGSKQSTLAAARPLIEAYLADKSREYQVDLTPDPNSYRVRRSPAELMNWPAWPVVGGTRFDYTCRPIDVSLPGVDRKARFYLRTTYAADVTSITERYREPRHALVRGCLVGHLSKPPTFKFWPSTKRLFEDDEVVELARRVVTGLRPEATDFRHEMPSRAVPWDMPDLSDSVYDEPIEDCRVVSYAVPGEARRRTVGVLYNYDVDQPTPRFPAELQTILKDPKTIRPFRVLVTRGCYGMNLMRPAEVAQ